MSTTAADLRDSTETCPNQAKACAGHVGRLAAGPRRVGCWELARVGQRASPVASRAFPNPDATDQAEMKHIVPRTATYYQVTTRCVDGGPSITVGIN